MGPIPLPAPAGHQGGTAKPEVIAFHATGVRETRQGPCEIPPRAPAFADDRPLNLVTARSPGTRTILFSTDARSGVPSDEAPLQEAEARPFWRCWDFSGCREISGRGIFAACRSHGVTGRSG